MIQGTKEFESIDYFFNMTLDSELRKEWQTLKAAVLAQQTATTGIPKLPPCSCCYAGKFCHVGIIPDTYMCYDAWRKLRAGV